MAWRHVAVVAAGEPERLLVEGSEPCAEEEFGQELLDRDRGVAHVVVADGDASLAERLPSWARPWSQRAVTQRSSPVEKMSQ